MTVDFFHAARFVSVALVVGMRSSSGPVQSIVRRHSLPMAMPKTTKARQGQIVGNKGFNQEAIKAAIMFNLCANTHGTGTRFALELRATTPKLKGNSR